MQDPGRATERHSLVSSGLGMLQYPVGTEPSFPHGDHVMGVTVIAWLTEHFLRAWGEEWATNGWLRIRFRSHLTAGLELVTSIEHGSEVMTLSVADCEGLTFATAEAAQPGRALPLPTVDSGPVPDAMCRPVLEELRGRTLMPIGFTFEAQRDLEFAATMADAGFWFDRRWAHPAWLCSAANAIIRHNVDFRDPSRWLNSGLELWLHGPVRDGDEVRLSGRIIETFEGSRHRFAVAALAASVDGVVVATIRNTFAFGPLGAG